MTHAVYRHYPPQRLRPPDATILPQGGGDVPPPISQPAAAYAREEHSLPVPRLMIAPLLEAGGGGVLASARSSIQAAYVREEARYPFRQPVIIHEPPPVALFPAEALRGIVRPADTRDEYRARQPAGWLAGLDDTVTVVVGDAHQPLAAYERERWSYTLPQTRVFSGVPPAPYVPPAKIARPSLPQSAPRRIEPQVAGILAVPEADYLPPKMLPAFYTRERLTWPQVSSPLAALLAVAPTIEPQRVSFKAGREKTVYLSAHEIRVFKAH